MYHPKKSKPNKILWSIFTSVAIFMMVTLAIFGGITLYEVIYAGDPDFDEPPPAERIDRVPLEYQVRLQQQQQQSSRPQQRLQVDTVANVSTPDLDIQVPDLNNPSNLGRVGDGSFGGLGDGSGLGIGQITVEMFDLRASGESFLFVIDVRRDLMQDAKGGIPTYAVIKEDLIRVIDELPSGVLFNVMLYDHVSRMEVWEQALVPATDSNKRRFAEWLKPVNTSLNSMGIRSNNFRTRSWQSDAARKLLTIRDRKFNRDLLILMAALEMQPDAIYIFTDDLPSMDSGVERSTGTNPNYERQMRDFEREVRRAGFDSVEDYRRQRQRFSQRVTQRMNEFKQQENRRRESQGIAPRVYTGQEDRDLRNRIEQEFSRTDDYVPHIGGAPQQNPHVHTPIRRREVNEAFDRLMRMYYDQHAQQRPMLNAVIFRGADEEWTREQDRQVRELVRSFDGDHRVLKGLGAIDTEAARRGSGN